MIRRLIILLLIVGCDNSTESKDCADVVGGTAGLDSCAVCVGGTTNLTACAQDCAGIWGGDAVSRLMGDIDGDGYITGDCCEQASCQNNPEHEINPPCNGPVGDAYGIYWIPGNLGGIGCGDWTPEQGNDPPSADNCPVFYWIDIDGDDEITPFDAGCVAQLNAGLIGTDNYGGCCVPDTSDSPCAGKCVGEECCISD